MKLVLLEMLPGMILVVMLFYKVQSMLVHLVMLGKLLLVLLIERIPFQASVVTTSGSAYAY